jgi:hypothetical protein
MITNMLRQRWDILGKLVVKLPPRSLFGLRKNYAEAVQDEILESFGGERSVEVNRSARFASYIIAHIIEDGYNVITPEDIHSAIELGAVESTPDLIPEYRNDVESWLGIINLKEIDPTYTRIPQLSRFNRIWVAPIAPTIDALLNSLGNPAIISDTTIGEVIRQEFTSYKMADRDHTDILAEQSYEEIETELLTNHGHQIAAAHDLIRQGKGEKSDIPHDTPNVEQYSRINELAEYVQVRYYADRLPEISGYDVPALCGWIRAELENNQWVRVSIGDANNTVWISPKRFNDILRERGTVLESNLVDQEIMKTTMRETPELGLGAFDYSVVSESIKSRLEKHGWRDLTWGVDSTYWYTDETEHLADLISLGLTYEDIVNTPGNKSLEELEDAKIFFSSNAYAIMKRLDTSKETVEQVLKRLRAETRATEALSQLDEAEPVHSGDVLTSEVDTSNTTEREVVWRLQKAAREEEKEEDSEDDDDEIERVGPDW